MLPPVVYEGDNIEVIAGAFVLHKYKVRSYKNIIILSMNHTFKGLAYQRLELNYSISSFLNMVR